MIYTDGFVKRGKYWGWIVCDEDGKTLACDIKRTEKTPEPYFAECYGILKAIKILEQGGAVFTDSLWMKKKLVSARYVGKTTYSKTQRNMKFITLFNQIVREASKKGIFIQWVPRGQNKAGLKFDEIKMRSKTKHIPIQYEHVEYEIKTSLFHKILTRLRRFFMV